MNSRTTPLPAPDDVIAQFRKSPEEGQKALKSLLDHRDTSVASKLQLMSRLLLEIDKKTAVMVIRSLPRNPLVITHNLAQVFLPYQALDSLSDLLIQQKILSSKHKLDLYLQFARVYSKRKDIAGQIHFLNHALALPSSPWEKRHRIHIILAITYSECHTDLQDNKIFIHFKEAFNIETSGRVGEFYILTSGVISEFLKIFKKSTQQRLDKSVIDQLNVILQLVPNDQRVIKAVTDYVDEGIKHLQQSINTILLKALLDLATILPILKVKIPALLDLVMKIPKGATNLSFKANCFCVFKYYDKAIESANEALHENPADPDALLALGTSLFELGQVSSSLSPFLRLLKRDDLSLPQRHFVYSRLSAAYLDLGNPLLAIEYAERAISFNTPDVNTYINRIVATFELGEAKQAKKLLSEARKLFPASSKEIDLCQAQLFPHQVSSELEEKAPSNMILSQIYFHIAHRQYDEAHRKADFLLNRETQKGLSHIALAAIYEAQRSWDKALEHLLAAKSDIDPLIIASRMRRAYIYLKQYSLAEEQAWFILNNKENTSKQGRRERVGAISTLLHIYNHNQDYGGGIEKLRQALNLKDLLDLEKQQLYYSLADLHYSHNDFDAATVCAKQAIDISPQHVPDGIYYLLGHSYYWNNKKNEAIEPLLKFLKTNPRDASAHLTLGYIYYFEQSSSSVKAIDHFSQALALDPSCIVELTAALPENIIEQLQSQDGSRSRSESNDSTESFDLLLEEKEKNTSNSSATSLKINSTESTTTSSTALYLSSFSSIEPKTVEPSLSAEQLTHRLFQAEKQRQKYQAQRQLLIDHDHDNEEKAEEGWDIPDVGFLSCNNPDVSKIAFARHSKKDSHLHGFLNTQSLQKTCPTKLLSEWQKLLLTGKMVGKKGEGIRMLTAAESAKVAEHIGKGYVAKLKLVGMFGDIRAYAKMVAGRVNTRNKVLCFDATINKSHSL